MANTNQGNQNQGNRNQSQGSRDNNQGQSGSGRGFASMDPDRQREIAAEGGRAAHASGNAHEFTSQEARAAGAKSHGGGANNASSGSGNTRGSSSEQQARAGSQSHKNDR
ncbi:MAG: KGG domain-containing protein [Diaphorobacter nitroreducens]|uniref:KGG domain-containing protein n=1 Tax=Diaphorobacter nitroreducens TaxID=164759 RepID=UPI003C71663F